MASKTVQAEFQLHPRCAQSEVAAAFIAMLQFDYEAMRDEPKRILGIILILSGY